MWAKIKGEILGESDSDEDSDDDDDDEDDSEDDEAAAASGQPQQSQMTQQVRDPCLSACLPPSVQRVHVAFGV